MSFLNKQSCLHSSNPNPRPSPVFHGGRPPTPTIRGTINRPTYRGTINRGGPSPVFFPSNPFEKESEKFEIRSNAMSYECLSLQNNVIVLEHCNKSRQQQWTFNKGSRYIRNTMTGGCLVPNMNDQASKRIRLALHPCPAHGSSVPGSISGQRQQAANANIAMSPFQWGFSRGHIRNSRASSGGNMLVIEAVRVLRRNSRGGEDVIFLPILSASNAAKKDFQVWRRDFV